MLCLARLELLDCQCTRNCLCTVRSLVIFCFMVSILRYNLPVQFILTMYMDCSAVIKLLPPRLSTHLTVYASTTRVDVMFLIKYFHMEGYRVRGDSQIWRDGGGGNRPSVYMRVFAPVSPCVFPYIQTY